MSLANIFKGVKRKLKIFNGPKVFAIGDNKTGTTSLKIAMENLGYVVGMQRPAERMLKDWTMRDFRKIVKHSRTGEFFQDFPYSKPYTFVVLDHEFPGSKFILTIRDSPDQWYGSLSKFHARKWGKNGRIPTREDLQEANYLWKGRPWESNRAIYDTPDNDPYNREILIKNYSDYNNSVCEYFRHRPQDLLILNVAERGAYKKLTMFLGKKVEQENFPWENKTINIKN